jgi:allophanate hydrolase subunit 2
LRCYLALSGGMDVPVVLGSRSTDLKIQMGGLDGRALQAGDVLTTGDFCLPIGDPTPWHIQSS